MAQGEQARIGHAIAGPKQLLKLNGEQTIFERTVGQLRAHQVPPENITAIIHGGPWWIPVMDQVRVGAHIQPDPGASVVGAIIQCQQFWGKDHTTVLLGDVVYSNHAIGAMLMPIPSVAFFGRKTGNRFTGKKNGEIFGLTFGKSGELGQAVARLGMNWARHCDTKLWTALEQCYGAPFLEINDYTDDIDTEDDLKKRLPLLRELVARDV